MSAARLLCKAWSGPATVAAQPWITMSPAPALCSVSAAWGNAGWQRRPRADTPALIGASTGILFFDGVLSTNGGTTSDPSYAMGAEAIARGYDLLPMRLANGNIVPARLVNFTDGHTTTYMVNIARGEVGRWFAQKMVDLFPWADGWHVDYWTPLDFVFASAPSWNAPYVGVGPVDGSFATAWMNGLNRCIHHYRVLRAAQGKATTVIGQQWQNTTDRELDGRWIEQAPMLWGTAPWQTYHQAQFSAFAAGNVHGGAASKMVVEARTPFGTDGGHTWSAQDRTDVVSFASTNACYVAWGQDASAGVSWPG